MVMTGEVQFLFPSASVGILANTFSFPAFVK
jgi:hypothetical protein